MAKENKNKMLALEMAVEIAKVQFAAIREKDKIETTKIVADAEEFLGFLED